jgi:hypothetical protein
VGVGLIGRALHWVALRPWLAILVALAVGAAGWQQLDTANHERCVAGRRDIRDAFVAAAVALDADAEQVRLVDEAVAEALPVDEC